MSLLEVKNLNVQFNLTDTTINAVNDISLSINPGQTLGIVGESGSGKSVTAQSVMGLLPPRTAEITGEVYFQNELLNKLDEKQMRKIRGKEISMIFQDPLSSLHPFYTVGKQIAEAYLVHNPKANKKAAKAEAIKVMNLVGIPEAEVRVDDYPHQFSGGMRQRIMIAMALVNHPKLLIADEPTTALDVTVQAQILNLLKDLQKEFNMAIILITHDFAVVNEICDQVIVMYAGRAVEKGSVDQVFSNPQHPYTVGLLDSLVSADENTQRLIPIPGSPPSASELPSGCAFAPRCNWANTNDMPCATQVPELQARELNHQSACYLPLNNRKEIFQKRLIS